MTTRKAIALAGSALALAILSPPSALAGAGATNLPFKGTETDTVSLNTQTYQLTAAGTGVGAFIGKSTLQMEGNVTDVTQGDLYPRFAGSGTAALVAANGDRLAGTMTFHTDDLAPKGHTAWGEITITPQDSTGRFANTTGKLDTTCQVGRGTPVGPTMVMQEECTASGHLNLHGS